jgi:hypothetical protein
MMIQLQGKRGIGKYTLVDDDDYPILSLHTWWYGSNGYVVTNIKVDVYTYKFNIPMHTVLLGKNDIFVVDHINGNSLDNRRCNLRLCTHKQNCWNRRANIKSTSQYKGVFLVKKTGKWRTQIKYQGKIVSIGNFDNELEAARAYDNKAKLYYGEYARLNLGENNGED